MSTAPDHSTISQLRHRKFDGTTIFRDIFDEIVRKCIKTGLIGGKLLMTDSTHIRANARDDLREVIEVPDTPSQYMQKLDREAYNTGLIKEPVKYENTKTKKITKSTTDPECGLMKRPGKPIGFHYLNHQTCDSKYGIITDVFVTAGISNDSTPHVARLEYQLKKFHLTPTAICADGGYDCREVYQAMMKSGIKTYIPPRNKPNSNCNYTKEYAPEHFRYDTDLNQYICPAGKKLRYMSYLKGKGYKRYVAKQTDCQKCKYKEQCIGNSKISRQIDRHLHQEAKAPQMKFVGTQEYHAAMRLRKIWCEGNFSHQKEQHNLRRTRKRGIERLTEQCLLSACALNLKRLIKYLGNRLYNHYLSLIINLTSHSGWFLFFEMLLCQQHHITTT